VNKPIDSYVTYCEELLIAAEAEYNGPTCGCAAVSEMIERAGFVPEPNWNERAAKDMARKGFGEVIGGNNFFSVSLDGMIEARKIIRRRRIPKLISYLQENGQPWVNVANFIVALIALVVAVVAIFKN